MAHLIDWGREALLLVALASVPVIATWIALVGWRSRHAPRRHAAASATIDVAFLLSLVVIGVLGLRPGLGLPGGFEQWNLVPFRDLARALDGRPWGMQPAVVGLLGNLLLFLPFGFVSAVRFRRLTWPAMFALALAIAVGVELWQALTATGRSSDVTDVIMNTAGGMLGFAIWRALPRRRPRTRAASGAAQPTASPHA